MNQYYLLPANDLENNNNEHQLNNCFYNAKLNQEGDKNPVEYVIHFFSTQEDEKLKRETNRISNSKYSWFSAIPKILHEQFSKMVNIYYLIIAILQSIKEISYSGGVPVILLPLTIVTIINGLKDFLEDLKRKHSDDEENSRATLVFDNKTKMFHQTKWSNVRLGDIVKVKKKEAFPADLILLKSSNSNGMCFIETKNIDGETNLKSRIAKRELSDLCSDENLFSKFSTRIIKANQPNDQIYQFEGKIYNSIDMQTNLVYNSDYIQLNQDSLLLRGCNLQYTDYIIGVAIYLGHHTKSMMNSFKARTKTSKVEDIMNYQILLILILQISLSLLAALFNLIGYYYKFSSLAHYIYLPNTSEQVKHFTIKMFLTRTGTWILIFTNFVPISLLVTMEMIKFIQGMFVSWDIEMIDRKRGINTKVQTSTLNEELGQVSYIFSDKTGTLTKNSMKLKKIMIGKEVFGHNDNVNQYEGNSKHKHNDDSSYCLNDKYGEINKSAFIDYEQKLTLALNSKKENFSSSNHIEDIKHFMACLCLCHSVLYDYEEWDKYKQLVYNGSSADEIALLNFARQFDHIFKEKTNNDEIIIEIKGEQYVYKIISLLKYTSERRKMSIIVKAPDPDGRYYLYTKGDDSIILPKVIKSSDFNKESNRQNTLLAFAQEGLRTLAIAYKEISEKDIIIIQSRLESVNENNIDGFYNEIENNLLFLGFSAIEDELQDDVEDTLASFISSGIKIWVLTGDKKETAISIGYSCGLLTKDQCIINIIEGAVIKEINNNLLKAEERLFNNEQVSMVISTKELNIIFSEGKELLSLFLSVAIRSHTVICCRITPKQKGDLVQLIKKHLKGDGTTLAIGDGANDVTMLSTADIGIGINGVEGSEAARVSDYSIAQFSYLKKLLFVHGRESYRKNTFVVCYNFYKNALFVMPQFWMGIVTLFSGQVLFDRWIYQFFNPFYTSLPIIWYGIYDTELYRKLLLKDPFYYKQGIHRRLFHSGRFWKWVFSGCIQGLFVFFFSFYTFKLQGSNGKMQDLWSIGTMAYSGIVLISNIKIIQYTSSHTVISLSLVAFSVASYYLSVHVMAMKPYFYIYNNWNMVFYDLRFYYGTIGLLVFVFTIDITVNKIIEYCSLLPSIKKQVTTPISLSMELSSIENNANHVYRQGEYSNNKERIKENEFI